MHRRRVTTETPRPVCVCHVKLELFAKTSTRKKQSIRHSFRYPTGESIVVRQTTLKPSSIGPK